MRKQRPREVSVWEATWLVRIRGGLRVDSLPQCSVPYTHLDVLGRSFEPSSYWCRSRWVVLREVCGPESHLFSLCPVGCGRSALGPCV